MTLEEILDNWEKDCVIDPFLHNESAKSHSIGFKYLKELAIEKRNYKSLETKYNKLKYDKTIFLMEGPSTIAEQNMYEAKGWKLPAKGKLKVKTEVETYLNVDTELSDISAKMYIAQNKIETLQEIMKQINARSYIINNEIELRKHEHVIKATNS